VSSRAAIVSLLGPAFVAGVAYLDPGNVAANITAGAQLGFLLVWVVVAGNLIAWLVQYLSASLGIVTGKSLPEVLGTRITSRGWRLGYWAQGELIAMATDVAEVIGGAIALNLLWGIPLWLGGLIVGVVSLAFLGVHGRWGAKPFERLIVFFLLIIAVGFGAILWGQPIDATAFASGLVPRLEGSESLLLAAAILGATVMPHAIYAHSGFSRDRISQSSTVPIRRLRVATRVDVTLALLLAGAVNIVTSRDRRGGSLWRAGHGHPGRRVCRNRGGFRHAHGDLFRRGSARVISRIDRGWRLCRRGNHARPDPPPDSPDGSARHYGGSRDHHSDNRRRADHGADLFPGHPQLGNPIRSDSPHHRDGRHKNHGRVSLTRSRPWPRGRCDRSRDHHQQRSRRPDSRSVI
jgi:hypothetical protein